MSERMEKRVGKKIKRVKRKSIQIGHELISTQLHQSASDISMIYDHQTRNVPIFYFKRSS